MFHVESVISGWRCPAQLSGRGTAVGGLTATVVGSRFGLDLLTVLGTEPTLDLLVEAELIDQVRSTPPAEYVFHHPLIRTVAYESQLKSDRIQLHRRVAIETGAPASADEMPP